MNTGAYRHSQNPVDSSIRAVARAVGCMARARAAAHRERMPTTGRWGHYRTCCWARPCCCHCSCCRNAPAWLVLQHRQHGRPTAPLAGATSTRTHRAGALTSVCALGAAGTNQRYTRAPTACTCTDGTTWQAQLPTKEFTTRFKDAPHRVAGRTVRRMTWCTGLTVDVASMS